MKRDAADLACLHGRPGSVVGPLLSSPLGSQAAPALVRAGKVLLATLADVDHVDPADTLGKIEAPAQLAHLRAQLAHPAVTDAVPALRTATVEVPDGDPPYETSAAAASTRHLKPV